MIALRFNLNALAPVIALARVIAPLSCQNDQAPGTAPDLMAGLEPKKSRDEILGDILKDLSNEAA